MAALVGANEGIPHIPGVNLGTADRNVKQEFSSPMALAQSGYLAGFLRSRAYDMHIHVLGASVTMDSGSGSANHFDSYVKVFKGSVYDSYAESYAAAAAATRASEGFDPHLNEEAEGDVKRTKVAKSTMSPVWREDLALSSLEFDEVVRIELKTPPKSHSGKGVDQNHLAHPDQNVVCWASFSPGDVMCAIVAGAAATTSSSSNPSATPDSASVGGEGGAVSFSALSPSSDRARVQFKLVGDTVKGLQRSATVTAVVALDPDMTSAIRGCMRAQKRATATGVATAGGSPSTAESSSAGSKYVSVNRNNASLLLTATSLARVGSGSGSAGERQARLSSISRRLHGGHA